MVSVTISMAQRLVRKLCNFCKVENTLNEEETKIINEILNGMKEEGKDLSKYLQKYNIKEGEAKIFKATGCEKCNSTGFSGRIGIFEAIKLTQSRK